MKHGIKRCASATVTSLALLLNGCAGVPAQREGVREEDHVVPVLRQFIEPVAPAIGLESLQQANFADGVREARVWVGFGLVQPDKMLRFVRDADGPVHGSLLIWFERSDNAEDANYNLQLVRQLEQACSHALQTQPIMGCTERPGTHISWNALYARLVAIGLWDLPDESRLPRPEFAVSDGVAMLVELRDGARYRAYEYGNPMFRSEPEARKATEILRAVQELAPLP